MSTETPETRLKKNQKKKKTKLTGFENEPLVCNKVKIIINSVIVLNKNKKRILAIDTV